MRAAMKPTVALLMFAYSFLAMTSHNILKPITKSKFIDQLGADNLPYVLLASSVLIGVLMHLYGSADRGACPASTSIPLTQSAIVGAARCLLGPAADRAPSGSRSRSTSSARFSGSCSSASSGRWPTTSTTRARPSGCSASSAAARASAARSARRSPRSPSNEFGSNNLLLVSAAILAVCVAIVLRIVRPPHVGQHAEFERRTRRRRARGASAAGAVAAPAESSRGRRFRRGRCGDRRSATQHGGRGVAGWTSDAIAAFLAEVDASICRSPGSSCRSR